MLRRERTRGKKISCARKLRRFWPCESFSSLRAWQAKKKEEREKERERTEQKKQKDAQAKRPILDAEVQEPLIPSLLIFLQVLIEEGELAGQPHTLIKPPTGSRPRACQLFGEEQVGTGGS